MTRCVAFLRAVNLGPARKVEMARLREVVAGLGYDDVSTHINSGNVAFTGPRPSAAMERALEEAFEAAFGFEVPTFVRSLPQLSSIVGQAPFGDVPDGDTYLVAFLRKAPTKALAATVEQLATDRDELAVIGSQVFWHIRGKRMDSELTDKAWAATGVGVTTTRSMTMLRKLVAKLSA